MKFQDWYTAFQAIPIFFIGYSSINSQWLFQHGLRCLGSGPVAKRVTRITVYLCYDVIDYFPVALWKLSDFSSRHTFALVHQGACKQTHTSYIWQTVAGDYCCLKNMKYHSTWVTSFLVRIGTFKHEFDRRRYRCVSTRNTLLQSVSNGVTSFSH